MMIGNLCYQAANNHHVPDEITRHIHMQTYRYTCVVALTDSIVCCSLSVASSHSCFKPWLQQSESVTPLNLLNKLIHRASMANTV